MSAVLSVIIFIVGLILVIYFSEKLVEGTAGVSLSFGISAFLISVIFIGFDPENLALGAVASYEGVTGIALGSIIGAAMVAIALAFGITALVAPMEFERVPGQILAVPLAAALLMGTLSLDGLLSRIDGKILLSAYILSVIYLIQLEKNGINIHSGGEITEIIEEEEASSKWKSFGLLVLSLVAIIAGSELLVSGSEVIITDLGISDTVFGMTILVLLVSIEELARELPAALKGNPEISFGNVTGSVLAFFLCNAGIISLIKPLEISPLVLRFYLPVSIITLLIVLFFMSRKKISRQSGAVLVTLYLVFFLGGYFWP